MENTFTLEQLRQYDGQDGNPAYVAFKGKVYDVSASGRWPAGTHLNIHHAGGDLTPKMEHAPHAADVLEPFPVVGVLKRSPLQSGPVRAFLRLHPHPILVHLPMALSLLTPFMLVLYLYTRAACFDLAAFILLGLGSLSSIPAGLSGYLSWKVNYEGRATRIFRQKKTISIGITMMSLAAFLWRFLAPAVLTGGGAASLGYIVLVLAMAPAAAVLGHLGGKIVYG